MRHPFGTIEYPALPAKPRSTSITSVLDRGAGPGEARDRVAIAGEWIDVVKLGWATARLTPGAALREKIEIYRAAGIDVCSGGTFLEIAFAQNRVPEFLNGARDLGLAMVEVSNGVHPMSEEDKLGLIARARSAGFAVWSEVGKKDPDEDARMGIDDRCAAIARELEAGAAKVILEARESGTVGIYDRAGIPAVEMIQRIVEHVGRDRLVFEAPRKEQQLWMVRTLGPEVNLGNVAPEEALALATLRTGLRGDTFREIHLHGLEIFLGLGVHGALEARARGGVIVLIDALRASATMIAALEMGMAAKARPWSSPPPTASNACSARQDPRASCSSARLSTGARSRVPPDGWRASAACPSPCSWQDATTRMRLRTRSPPARSRARCPKHGCTASCRRRRRSKPISAPAIQAAT